MVRSLMNVDFTDAQDTHKSNCRKMNTVYSKGGGCASRILAF